MLLPRWGDRPLQEDITRSGIHELLDTLVQAKKIGASREIRKHVRALFNWAVEREILQASPPPPRQAQRACYPDDHAVSWMTKSCAQFGRVLRRWATPAGPCFNYWSSLVKELAIGPRYSGYFIPLAHVFSNSNLSLRKLRNDYERDENAFTAFLFGVPRRQETR